MLFLQELMLEALGHTAQHPHLHGRLVTLYCIELFEALTDGLFRLFAH